MDLVSIEVACQVERSQYTCFPTDTSLLLSRKESQCGDHCSASELMGLIQCCCPYICTVLSRSVANWQTVQIPRQRCKVCTSKCITQQTDCSRNLQQLQFPDLSQWKPHTTVAQCSNVVHILFKDQITTESLHSLWPAVPHTAH